MSETAWTLRGYELEIVPGSSIEDLDLRRLTDYFRRARGQDCPEYEDHEGWERLLFNTDLMLEDRDRFVPNVAGMLLFGEKPNRYLPQAGISAAAYPGQEKDYATRERLPIRGPLVSLFTREGKLAEPGVIEEVMAFVRRNLRVKAWINEGGQRVDWWELPLDAVREAIVNAVTHRDYTLTGMDIELSLYEDRLEVISPGRLPNSVTVEKMGFGYRATRNELVKEVLRDYRYIEATGLGVPRKIIRGMREHNDTEPDLVELDDRFLVRLWKGDE